MAMVERLDAVDAEYALHYCTRSPEQTASRTASSNGCRRAA
jgi:hypothetical protein